MKFLFLFIFTFSLFAWEQNGSIAFRHNDPLGVIDDQTVNAWWARGEYALKHETSKFLFSFETNLQYEDNNLFLFSLKKLSAKHLSEKLDIEYGKFPLNWSSLDSDLGIGKINNRENFDFFHPRVEGLAGINLTYKLNPHFSFDVFGSFLYIPELNPPLNIDKKNRSIDSKSPWASAPDSTATVGSATFDLLYDTEIPEIMDIILKVSYGLNLSYKINNFSANAFYVRKPENKLTNKASVELPAAGSGLKAVVSIAPLEFQHSVFGGELGYKFKENFKAFTRFISSKVDYKPADDFDIASNNVGVGITVEKNDESYLDFGIHSEFSKIKGTLGYLIRVSDFQKTTILTGIPRWENTLHFDLDYQFHDKFSVHANLKYDFSNKDRVYYMGIDWKAKSYLTTSLGAQIIGSPSNGDGFWANYRQNDSIFAEVKLSL